MTRKPEPDARGGGDVGMDTQEERFEKVKEAVRDDLEGHFQDLFAFEPIVVHQDVDEFGDGDGEVYLRILIVFDGDQDLLDPAWTLGLIRRISAEVD